MNRKALQKCRLYAIANNEVRCANCGSNYALSIAHRKKRRHYNSVEELSDPHEWLTLCIRCHEDIEFSRDKTEELFIRLRDCMLK